MKEGNRLVHTEVTELLLRKAARLRLPVSGTFELSPVCNFSCRMCYVRKTAREVAASPRPILTLADWRRIAAQAKDAGTLYLLLTGGEPLLWPEFWTLYEELVDMGFLVSVNTNGSLFDDEAVARFRRRPPRRVNITLYGASDESYENLCGVTGVFSQVDRAVRGLKDAGILVKLNCSLTPRNERDLEKIVAYAKELDLPLTVVTYMFPPVRRTPEAIGQNERFTPEEAAAQQLRYLRCANTPEGYQKALQKIVSGTAEMPGLEEGCVDPVDGKVRCRAGSASFWVSWDGWLQACGMMETPRIDLASKNLQDAWEQLTDATEALQLTGVCGSCPNRTICHPCAAVAWTETGSVSGIPEYMCRMTRHMVTLAKQELTPE